MLLKALGSDPNVRPKPSEILESQWFKTQAEQGFGGKGEGWEVAFWDMPRDGCFVLGEWGCVCFAVLLFV